MPENLQDFRINGLGAANASCCGIVAMDRRGARKVLLPIMTKTVRGIIPSSSFPEAREIFSEDNHQKSKLVPLTRAEGLGRSFDGALLRIKGKLCSLLVQESLARLFERDWTYRSWNFQSLLIPCCL